MAKTDTFNADININIKGIDKTLKEIKDLQKSLAEAVKQISKGVTVKIDSDGFKEYNDTLNKTVETLLKATKAKKQFVEEDETASISAAEKRMASFNETIARSNKLLQETPFEGEKAGLDALKGAAKSVKDAFTDIKAQPLSVEGISSGVKTVYKAFEEMNTATTQLRMGLNLAFSDPTPNVNRFGMAAEGLRVALFGIGSTGKEVTGVMGQVKSVLESVSYATLSTTANTNELGMDLKETANQGVKFNREMGEAIFQFSSAVRQAGLKDTGGVLGNIKEQFNVTANQYSKVSSSIDRMGKVDQAVASSIQKGSVETEMAFKRLDKLGIIPTVNDIKRLEEELAKTTDDKQAAALENQIKQYAALRKTYDEIRKTAVVANAELSRVAYAQSQAYNARSTGFFTKATDWIKGVINKTTQATTAQKEYNDSLFLGENGSKRMSSSTAQFGSAMEKAGNSASILKDVLWGTFLGNQLTNAIGMVGNTISNIFGTITNYIAGLKNEFMESNNLVQNFDVTLRQMLTGFDAEKIEKAMKGTNDFIRETAAKTPFTLGTAQQAFQQLATQGFKPDEWLLPMANAAAYANKPMEQLIFAVTRLKAGSKGLGVDMIRDFGIPVQQVGQWVDKTSKKVLDLNQVAGKTPEELKSAGYEFEQWTFKNGELMQKPQEAVRILLGYMNQAPAIAGAATARVMTITGQLSNLGDAVTNILTSLGQPIFKSITGILADINGVLSELSNTMGPFAQVIGEELATNISNLWSTLTGIPAVITDINDKAKEATDQLRSDKFKAIADAILTYLKPALQVILALVKGDWGKAWGIFLNLAKNAIKGLSDFLQTTGKDAMAWGAKFVGMIAKGLVTAAATTLKAAVTLVTKTITSFLKPGSPPEEGPLSTIDKWGAGLVKVFGEGFKQADFSFITDALTPIKEAFSGDAYKEIRGNVISIVKGINESGTINETVWETVASQLGGVNTEMAKYVRAELELKKVTKEYEDAQKAGFISDELQQRLELTKSLVDLEKSNLPSSSSSTTGSTSDGTSSTDSATSEADTYAANRKKLENQYKAGILDKKAYYAALESLDKEYATTLAESEDIAGAKKKLAESKKENAQYREQNLKDEKVLLEKKKKLGLVNEVEYLSQLQSLEKSAAEEALAAGDEATAKQLTDQALARQKSIDAASLEQQKKDLLKQVAQEKEILEQKYKLGLINEQEYRTGLLNIQQNYVDQLIALKAGPAAIQRELDELKKLKDEVAKFNTIPMENAAQNIMSMGDKVTGEFEKMMESLKKEMDTVGTSTWEDLGKTFNESFTPIWDSIKTSISEGLGGVFDTSTSGSVKDQIMQFLFGTGKQVDEMGQVVGDKGLFGDLSKMFDSITDGLTAWRTDPKNSDKIKETGKWVADTVKQGIIDSFGLGTKKGENPVGKAIIGFITDAFKSSSESFTTIKTTISSYLSSVWQGLGVDSTQAEMAASAGATLISKLLFPFQSAGSDIYNIFMTDTVPKAMNAFQQLPAALSKALLSTIGDILNEWNNRIVEALSTAANNLVNRVTDAISNGKPGILAGFIEWKDIIVGVFTDIYDVLVGHSIVPDMVSDIVNVFRTLPEMIQKLDLVTSIANIFSNLATSMVTVGKNFTTNLAKGMSSVKETAVSSAKTVASKISNYFPHSPAKEGPLKIPVNWEAYLLNGLDSTIKTATESISGLQEIVGSTSNGLTIKANTEGGLRTTATYDSSGNLVKAFQLSNIAQPANFTSATPIDYGPITKNINKGAVYFQASAFANAFPNVVDATQANSILSKIQSAVTKGELLGSII